jgi:Ran GTPase-activating protein (RanGAP) involved in mRNA processing and transport
VLSLSLTNNKIGAAEIQNVATPDFTTGGEALGTMLQKNTTLLELDCSWNFIRLESACAVAQSLTVNKSLQVLKLSYNGFGDVPTQELGVALKQNDTLEMLDLAYNSITPKAATVLQNALIHNKKIRSLVLDGNVLGNVGAKALVAAVQRASGESRILSISFCKSFRYIFFTAEYEIKCIYSL